MTLVLRSPYASVLDYLGLPARTGARYFTPRDVEGQPHVLHPHFEVEAEKGQVKLNVELPGVEAEDIEVTAGGNVITVKFKHNYDRAVERGGYHWREHGEKLFARSVPMPEEADFDKTVANFENGMLEITVPVAEKPAAKIEVHSAGYEGETGNTQAEAKESGPARANSETLNESAPLPGESLPD
jgi:HSP20 family protein